MKALSKFGIVKILNFKYNFAFNYNILLIKFLVETKKIKRTLTGHTARIGVVAWQSNNLSSGKCFNKLKYFIFILLKIKSDFLLK